MPRRLSRGGERLRETCRAPVQGTALRYGDPANRHNLPVGTRPVVGAVVRQEWRAHTQRPHRRARPRVA